LQLAQYQLDLINQQIEQLYELKNVGVNIKLIDDLTRKGKEKDLEVAQKRLSLEQASQKKKSENAKIASESGGGVLGASRAGNQALDVARKQRERQLKTENFKTAEKIAPTQRDREKLAAQQAAGEMPSLAEKIQGGLSGIDPSQLAREAAASKFEKDRSFGKAGMAGTSGKLGEEKSSLGNETLQAIKKLVELMQSGTVVK
jgi:transcriptional regulator of acetoin/glycerol metabolism